MNKKEKEMNKIEFGHVGVPTNGGSFQRMV